LTADYLTFFFPGLVGWKHYAIAVAVIALIGYINVRGIQMVGAVATILEISILVPIVALCAIAATKWHHNPFSPLVPPHVPPFQVFGVGWRWDCGFTPATSKCPALRKRWKIRSAVIRSHLRSSFHSPSPRIFWRRCSRSRRSATGEVAHRIFSDAARLIGGPWLGFAMTIAAMITNLFAAERHGVDQHAHASTMAEDGYLPAAFSARHSALWHAVDRIIVFFDHLRTAGAEDDGAASDRT